MVLPPPPLVLLCPYGKAFVVIILYGNVERWAHETKVKKVKNGSRTKCVGHILSKQSKTPGTHKANLQNLLSISSPFVQWRPRENKKPLIVPRRNSEGTLLLSPGERRISNCYRGRRRRALARQTPWKLTAGPFSATAQLPRYFHTGTLHSLSVFVLLFCSA